MTSTRRTYVFTCLHSEKNCHLYRTLWDCYRIDLCFFKAVFPSYDHTEEYVIMVSLIIAGTYTLLYSILFIDLALKARRRNISFQAIFEDVMTSPFNPSKILDRGKWRKYS